MKKYVNGVAFEMTQEEIETLELSRIPSLEQQKQSLINVRLAYLKNKDWIQTKITCKAVLGESIEDDKIKYADELAKIKLARKEINEIESVDKIDNYSKEFI